MPQDHAALQATLSCGMHDTCRPMLVQEAATTLLGMACGVLVAHLVGGVALAWGWGIKSLSKTRTTHALEVLFACC